MNNHYFANDAVINDQHKELNIHGNLTTQQVVMIAKDFFAEGTEENRADALNILFVSICVILL